MSAPDPNSPKLISLDALPERQRKLVTDILAAYAQTLPATPPLSTDQRLKAIYELFERGYLAISAEEVDGVPVSIRVAYSDPQDSPQAKSSMRLV